MDWRDNIIIEAGTDLLSDIVDAKLYLKIAAGVWMVLGSILAVLQDLRAVVLDILDADPIFFSAVGVYLMVSLTMRLYAGKMWRKLAWMKVVVHLSQWLLVNVVFYAVSLTILLIIGNVVEQLGAYWKVGLLVLAVVSTIIIDVQDLGKFAYGSRDGAQTVFSRLTGTAKGLARFTGEVRAAVESELDEQTTGEVSTTGGEEEGEQPPAPEAPA